ncbi:MAG: class I SAM-dependent methyltransferase [Planctomycetota bacterium]
MPEYRDIYNDVVANDERYNRPENSPGLRMVMESAERLRMISGRCLDLGCGVGFALEYLAGPTFDLIPFGADISDEAIRRAEERLALVPGCRHRLTTLEDQTLPYDDQFFSLVTCFDMLEHLDEEDIDLTMGEIERVLRKGATMLVSVSTRESGMDDIFGENLHRTVKSIDWWVNKMEPDRAEYDGHRKQLTLWKHIPLTSRVAARKQSKVQATSDEASEVLVGAATTVSVNGSSLADDAMDHAQDSASLYQKIYEENPWYGDAEQGRCPGVRLIPEYHEWLISPVIDLGCGRGQTVEHLRELGMEATGIDQIEIHPEMRVGDITKPIEDMDSYQSAVCIDCIEHLYEEQVLGLFENMKQVKRQAFSIHNGESTGTGQELHVNRRSFVDWTKLVREHFDIATAIQLHENQILYLTQSKSE